MILVKSCPARPTNGSPWASSSAPGASPKKQNLAWGFPTPKTVCVRLLARSHRSQAHTCCCRICKPSIVSPAVGSLVAEATDPLSVDTGESEVITVEPGDREDWLIKLVCLAFREVRGRCVTPARC